jgi:thioredoxin reductase (NADPH)
MDVRDVMIVGAGPAGLAAAIASTKAGLTYYAIEKGTLVNSLYHYPAEMVFFTTPELMEIGGMPFVSPHDKPSRLEALRYYRRVTDAYKLDIVFDQRVVALRRGNAASPFTTETETAEGARRTYQSRTVVLATGAYDFANRMDVPGEDLPHVSHYFTSPHPYYRKQVVIVGGKNSAAEAALELYRAGGHATIVHRGSGLGDSIKYWVKPDIENRIREGSVGARFETTLLEIRPHSVIVEGPEGRAELPADAVFLLTGYTADTALLRAAGVDLHADTCGPRHDPETFETNVPGLYVIGAMVAGKASGRIFIENGRFHGQVAIDHVARVLRR